MYHEMYCPERLFLSEFLRGEDSLIALPKTSQTKRKQSYLASRSSESPGEKALRSISKAR